MKFVLNLGRSLGCFALLALAGCGSDGGSGVNSVSTTAPGGTGSTPTPTPVTPTGLSGSTSFGAAMQGGNFVSIPSTAGSYISYDAASNTYSLISTARSTQFKSGTSDPTEVSYGSSFSGTANSGSSIYVVTHTGNGPFVYSYAAFASVHSYASSIVPLTTNVSDDVAVFGMPTPTSAIPRTGSATYALDLMGTYLGTGTGSVNFGSGSYNFSGNITQMASYNGGDGISHTSASGTFQSTGTLASAGNGFSGAVNLTVGSNSYSGPIGGLFFGPAAQELGGTFVASSTTSGASGAAANPVVGAILGHK
ncbi:HupA family protein [Novosphingobium terrae]|uniref:hypothetical protein n=1 Tax=Novosphingobium terrae TaxID=2726189 RepID=UPI00197DEB6B|nr:hypothetical protein [Novosphingobium terrae]